MTIPSYKGSSAAKTSIHILCLTSLLATTTLHILRSIHSIHATHITLILANHILIRILTRTRVRFRIHCNNRLNHLNQILTTKAATPQAAGINVPLFPPCLVHRLLSANFPKEGTT